jgi:hypothetical protein
MPKYKLLVSVEGVSTTPTDGRVFGEYVVTLRPNQLESYQALSRSGRDVLPDVEILDVPAGSYRIEIGAYDTDGGIFGVPFFGPLLVGSNQVPDEPPSPFLMPGGFSVIAVPM